MTTMYTCTAHVWVCPPSDALKSPAASASTIAKTAERCSENQIRKYSEMESTFMTSKLPNPLPSFQNPNNTSMQVIMLFV